MHILDVYSSQKDLKKKRFLLITLLYILKIIVDSLLDCFIRVYDCTIKVYQLFCKLFQHDYCTSNEKVQNMMRIEPHLLSCTFVVTLTNDHKILINL